MLLLLGVCKGVCVGSGYMQGCLHRECGNACIHALGMQRGVCIRTFGIARRREEGHNTIAGLRAIAELDFGTACDRAVHLVLRFLCFFGLLIWPDFFQRFDFITTYTSN